MNKTILQLKNDIHLKIKNTIKKPLFLETLIGAVFSVAIIAISISGFQKETLSDTFEDSENYYTYTNQDDQSSGLWEEDVDWSELSRGDALSVIDETITETSAINKNLLSNREQIATPVPTDIPQPVTTPELPEGTTDNVEIPDITPEPDAPEESEEPEIILDPNGPVLYSEYQTNTITNSFGEHITLTVYNSNGDKLPAEYVSVKLNDQILFPVATFNQSISYFLTYIEGRNQLDITISDELSNTKLYQYNIFYEKPYNDTAVLSVDADSIGLGLLVPSTTIELTEETNLAEYVKELLKSNGYYTYSNGPIESNYTFKGIYKKDLYKICHPFITEEMHTYLLSKNPVLSIDMMNCYTDFVRNEYFTPTSKWIFEVNGERYFDSMSNYTPKAGDVINVRFTLIDGMDLDWLHNDYNNIENQ